MAVCLLHVLTCLMDSDCVFSPSTRLRLHSSRLASRPTFLLMAVFPTSSPTDTLSLDTPPSESLSPSPIQTPAPRTQNRQEKPQEEEEEDEGDRTLSVPCYEIHATGLRRCSEPLTFNLPPPGAEPADPALSPLMGSSELRFLSRYVFLTPRIHVNTFAVLFSNVAPA